MTDTGTDEHGNVHADRLATAAEQAFAALTTDQRARLARAVFEILEYDQDGQPGGEWSSETTQALGELFDQVGIVFTSPDQASAEPGQAGLPWTGGGPAGPGSQHAPSRIRYRVAGMAAHYTVRPTGDGQWRACLVITDCGREVPEAGTALGDFDTEPEAMAAAQRYETSRT